MSASLRRVAALADKDAQDLFRNPTMLAVLLMPVGFMLLFRLIIGDTASGADPTWGALPAPDRAVQRFLLGAGLCMSVGMVASMVLIYGIAEEKERRTLRTLMLAGVRAGEIAAAKGAVALAAVAAVSSACFFVAGADPALFACYLALTVLGAVPVILISLVLGLASRDQMTAGFFSMPALLVTLVPTFGMAGEAIERIGSVTPLGGILRLLSLAADGRLTAAGALEPLAVTGAWTAIGAIAFAVLHRRLFRDN